VKKKLKRKLPCKEKFENNEWHTKSNIVHQAKKIQKYAKIFESI